MGIRRISSNDSIADNSTHLYKIGAARRAKTKSYYEKHFGELPKKWHDLRIRFDVWWNTEGKNDRNNFPFLTGFCYSDVFAECLYFRPTNAFLSRCVVENITHNETNINRERIDIIKKGIADKYKLEGPDKTHSKVVFLPGTNILDKIVDFSKAKTAVLHGAKIKPHPLTSRYHIEFLKCEFGKNNVLPKYISGHQLLAGCEEMWCCINSEMGMVAVLNDKKYNDITANNETSLKFGGYKAIYDTIEGQKDRLEMILGCDYSGIVISNEHSYKISSQEQINMFFESLKFFKRLRC